SAIEASDLGSGLTEPRVFSCNRKIANNMKDMPSANRPSCNGSDYGFWNRSDHLLKVEYIQTRDGIIAHITSVTADTLVPSTTERFSAFPGKYYHPDTSIFQTNVHSVDHLLDRQWSESVVDFRAIDADTR